MTSRAPKKSKDEKIKRERIFEKGTATDRLQGDQFSWRQHLHYCEPFSPHLPPSRFPYYIQIAVACSIFLPDFLRR
ncbi:uncharacterized protein BO87DRAFT_148327 [Aspergillus neoniger CBS 115656]|uniref:Uncharacterized protein n=1 Tax=Aspergillus neoniger (strain CBS 115656) TaxID=1448310 RepID=A0A318YAY0_ASPNB|nr:hypothetical protein BO87DRAFT_148327 [Aspergillus neoniger CBS 115656]PYH30687.1 hypothetical protein BO87DRAFT_148327 [Aspergillus neoniger CBS 115656]